MKAFLPLIFLLVITLFAGAVGALYTMPAIPEWYAGLAKSALNPPNWVFGPVWTTLYVLMAVAAWRIFRVREREGAPAALALYLGHLALNSYWSFAFFGMRNPDLGLTVIGLLWLAVLSLTAWFFRLDRTAGFLMLPYLAWVTFASYLNYTITTLN